MCMVCKLIPALFGSSKIPRMISGAAVGEALGLVEKAARLAASVKGVGPRPQRQALDAELLAELRAAADAFDSRAILVRNILELSDAPLGTGRATCAELPDAGEGVWRNVFLRSCRAAEAWISVYKEWWTASASSPLSDLRERVCSASDSKPPAASEIEDRKADLEYLRTLLLGFKRFNVEHGALLPFECLVVADFSDDLLQLYLRENEVDLLSRRVDRWIAALDRLGLRGVSGKAESQGPFEEAVSRIGNAQAALLSNISSVTSALEAFEAELDAAIASLQSDQGERESE